MPPRYPRNTPRNSKAAAGSNGYSFVPGCRCLYTIPAAPPIQRPRTPASDDLAQLDLPAFHFIVLKDRLIPAYLLPVDSPEALTRLPRDTPTICPPTISLAPRCAALATRSLVLASLNLSSSFIAAKRFLSTTVKRPERTKPASTAFPVLAAKSEENSRALVKW